MRKISIAMASLSLLLTAGLQAQNKDTQAADKHFARFEYHAAVNEYLKLTERNKADGYTYRQLGDAYYHMYNPAEAAKWYERASKDGQLSPEQYYRWGQMLKAQGKYEAAATQLNRFAELNPSDQRAQAIKANPNYLPALKEMKAQFELTAAPTLNGDQSDFGAVLQGDDVYFASARNRSRKTFDWTNEPFLDIYRASRNSDGSFTEAVPVESLNTRWHDGPATFSADGNTVYYASESFKDGVYDKDKAARSKYGQVSLFRATRMGDKWVNITPLPFNSKEYSVSNPSLSKDGKTLYFSSNMPGGQGGLDIWKVEVNGDSYSEPQNLGPIVNTPGDESFPFIAEDNKTLYFASKGHQGFGGYDVFSVDLLKRGGMAQNLGQPINSSQDDFAFSLYEDKNMGFVSSNRAGTDNIYVINPVCNIEVVATVTDAKTGEILSDARVSLLDARRNVVGTERSDAQGVVRFGGECDKGYSLQAAKDGYESATVSIDAGREPNVAKTVALTPIEVIVTETEIILKEVFFDFDKSAITEAGAEELDKLVKVMQENEEMVIMVKSHTDNRGSDRYNLGLSERRAKATVDYILSKGISEDRISGKGYGKTEPKVDCGANCTEEEHAENRRSEFVIVKK